MFEMEEDTCNLLEAGEMMPCSLCEELPNDNTSYEPINMATCTQCKNRWCFTCAENWFKQSVIEMKTEATCPYCRSEAVCYPFDEIKFKDKLLNSDNVNEQMNQDYQVARKTFTFLLTYGIVVGGIIVYFYGINDPLSDDDLIYYFIYFILVVYVVTCLTFVVKSLTSGCCCRCRIQMF